MSAAILLPNTSAQISSPVLRPASGGSSASASSASNNSSTNTCNNNDNAPPMTPNSSNVQQQDAHSNMISSTSNSTSGNSSWMPITPSSNSNGNTNQMPSLSLEAAESQTMPMQQDADAAVGDGIVQAQPQGQTRSLNGNNVTNAAATATNDILATATTTAIVPSPLSEPAIAPVQGPVPATVENNMNTNASTSTAATAIVPYAPVCTNTNTNTTTNTIPCLPASLPIQSSTAVPVPVPVPAVSPTAAYNYNNSSMTIPHKGIVNLGNTCYLNSALQMLLSIDGFVDEIVSQYRLDMAQEQDQGEGASNENENETQMDIMSVDAMQECNSEPGPQGEPQPQSQPQAEKRKDKAKKYPLRDALAEFFISMQTTDTGTSNDNSTPSTSSTHTAQNPTELKKVLDGLTSDFANFVQQDSHEFLTKLLDLLRDELVKVHSDDDDDGQVEEEKMQEGDIVEEKVEKKGAEMGEASMDIPETETKSSTASNGEEVKAEEAQEDDFVVIEKEDASAPLGANLDEDAVAGVNGEDNLSSSNSRTPPSNPETSETSNKKAKVGTSPESARTQQLSKVPSFSELNLDGINTLLHGEKEAMSGSGCGSGSRPLQPRLSSSASASDNSCKLVGGRLGWIMPGSSKVRKQGDKSISDNSSGECMRIDEEPGTIDSSNTSNNDAAGTVETSSMDAGADVHEAENDEKEPEAAPEALWTNNPVDDNFTMAIRTHLKCDSCNYTRSQEEVHRHLSIEVGKDDANGSAVSSGHERTVQEGLRKYFQPEKLELKCEKCFGESATRSCEIIKLPKALIVHLKRFIVDVSPDYSRITYRKNQVAVEFGEVLSLENDDNDGVLGEFFSEDVSFPARTKKFAGTSLEECNFEDDGDESEGDYDGMSISSEGSYVDIAQKTQHYKIRSVVNHIGSSATCGHYTADAHKLYSNKVMTISEPSKSTEVSSMEGERQWTRFNDSFVSRIGEQEAMGEKAQQTAYMIIYELEPSRRRNRLFSI